MPRRGKTGVRVLTKMVVINVSPDLRDRVVAASYLAGYKGELGVMVRVWMEEGIQRMLEGAEKKKREYAEILANVRLMGARGSEVDKVIEEYMESITD